VVCVEDESGPAVTLVALKRWRGRVTESVGFVRSIYFLWARPSRRASAGVVEASQALDQELERQKGHKGAENTIKHLALIRSKSTRRRGMQNFPFTLPER